jgi:hypothetical protein
MRKIVALLAAAGMAVAPVAASAQDASALSITRAGAPMFPGLSFLQGDDEGDSNNGGGSTAVILGVVLVILIGVAAAGGNGEPSNSP